MKNVLLLLVLREFCCYFVAREVSRAVLLWVWATGLLYPAVPGVGGSGAWRAGLHVAGGGVCAGLPAVWCRGGFAGAGCVAAM